MTNERRIELMRKANDRLHEEQPHWATIPVYRLKEEIADAKRHGDNFITVKIPSGCEFCLSFEEAQAFIEWDEEDRRRMRYGR